MKDLIPVFDGKDCNYKSWKKKVKMWQSVASEQDEAKQGTLLILYMTGKAVELCLDETDTKVSTIITKLDSIYGDTDDLLNQFEEFERFKRMPNQTMKEFIHIFEQKVTHLKAKALDIPELILSSKLLKGANLPPNDEKIARATCNTSIIAETKASLLRLSNGLIDTRSNSLNMIKVVKEEMDEEIAFYTNQYQRGRPSNSRYQSNSMNRNTHHRLCYGCGQDDHWIKDCPDIRFAVQQLHSNTVFNNPQGRQPYRSNPKSTFMCADTDNTETVAPKSIPVIEKKVPTQKKAVKKVPIFFNQCGTGDDKLVEEAANKAVIDNAASVTVCGQEWYDNFTNILSPDHQQEITEDKSETIFVFGAGEIKASKVVSVPVDICGEKIDLEAHVLNADIPLLLSKDVMKGLGMTLNCETDTVKVHGKSFDVETTTSGHYVLPLLTDSDYDRSTSPTKLEEFISTLKTTLQRDDVSSDMLTYARWKASPEEERAMFTEPVCETDQYAWLSSSLQIPVRDDYNYDAQFEDAVWPPDQYYSYEPICVM